jgi:hypothetical protein
MSNHSPDAFLPRRTFTVSKKNITPRGNSRQRKSSEFIKTNQVVITRIKKEPREFSLNKVQQTLKGKLMENILSLIDSRI